MTGLTSAVAGRSAYGGAWRARWCVGLLAFSLSAGACEVTPEKITRWKESERGPKKLRETLGRADVSAALRAQALSALVELGMTSEALADLSQLAEGDRHLVVHESVARLGALLTPGGTGGAETTRVEREAKDALFLLRPEASPEKIDLPIDDALIAWTCADLVGRMTAGGQGTEKILLAIGARAAPRLTRLLQPGTPNLAPAAQLLGKIADEPTRAQAADQLIQATRQAGAAGLTDPTLQAIGLVGGSHATAFLVETAEHGATETREHALLALGQGNVHAGDSAALGAALRLAGDRATPGKIREAAFALAEHLGVAAVPGLLKLLGDPDETTRWRAVEAALQAGKDKAVQPVLEGLSPSRSYKQDDLDSYVVHDLAQLGPSALPPLRLELKSKSWPARACAVRALAQIGKADDAPSLDALASDSTPLRGWTGGATVGAQAKAAAATLRAKR